MAARLTKPPARYTQQQVIEALEKTLGLTALAADALGCHQRTIYNYINRHEAVKEVFEHLHERRLDLAEAQLWKQIDRGSIAAIIFYLKTQGKKRGYSERYEITGEDGNAIEVNNNTTLEVGTILGILSSGESGGSSAGGETS